MIEKKIVVLGGLYQGKHEYIRKNYLDQANSLAVDLAMLQELQKQYLDGTADAGKAGLLKLLAAMPDHRVLFFDSTQWLQDKLLKYDLLQPLFWDWMLGLLSHSELRMTLIFCIDELGCGMIPTEREARLFREQHGRWLQWAAAEADAVIRLVAGLTLALK